MNDEWLDSRLKVLDEPVSPDPRFAADLYAELAAELGLGIPLRPEAPRRTHAVHRSRRWLGTLLVAAFVVGGLSAAVAGVGGFLHRSPPDDGLVGPAPHVCALITPTEIGAIVGGPVTLTVPESVSTQATSSVSSCVYKFALDPGGTTAIILSITRYGDPGVAQAQVQAGILAHGALPGLGDAATYVAPGPFSGLLVLKGVDVLSIAGLSPDRGLDQTEAMARLILARL